MPRSQKSWTLARRSAKTSGVGSAWLSNTLMMPLFSATKMRPSAANSMLAGLVSPLHTTDSEKPVGRTDARAAGADSSVPRSASAQMDASRRQRME